MAHVLLLFMLSERWRCGTRRPCPRRRRRRRRRAAPAARRLHGSLGPPRVECCDPYTAAKHRHDYSLLTFASDWSVGVRHAVRSRAPPPSGASHSRLSPMPRRLSRPNGAPPARQCRTPVPVSQSHSIWSASRGSKAGAERWLRPLLQNIGVGLGSCRKAWVLDYDVLLLKNVSLRYKVRALALSI